MKKKLLAIVLAAAMVFTLLPAFALADAPENPYSVTKGGVDATSGAENDYEWKLENDEYKLFVYKTGLTISMANGVDSTTYGIDIAPSDDGDFTVNFSGVNTTGVVIVNTGNLTEGKKVTLNAAEGTTNTFGADEENPSINSEPELVLSGTGTFNLLGVYMMVEDYMTMESEDLTVEKCTVMIENGLTGLASDGGTITIGSGATVSIATKSTCLDDGDGGYMLLQSAPIMAVKLVIAADVNKVTLKGCTVEGEPAGGAVFCYDGTENAVTLGDGIKAFGSAELAENPDSLTDEVEFKAIELLSTFTTSYVGDDPAKTVVFKAVEDEDEDKDPEQGGSLFDGLFSGIFGLIRFKKIGDDIKTVSILKLVLDFVLRIFNIFNNR